MKKEQRKKRKIKNRKNKKIRERDAEVYVNGT